MGRAKLETDEFTLRRVAVVLECASLEGDKAAIAKHGVTLRTLARWREAFRTRDKVAQYVSLHRKALSEEYNLKASEAMQAHATSAISASTARRERPEKPLSVCLETLR